MGLDLKDENDFNKAVLCEFSQNFIGFIATSIKETVPTD
jgi:hypothetical protein